MIGIEYPMKLLIKHKQRISKIAGKRKSLAIYVVCIRSSGKKMWISVMDSWPALQNFA